MIKLDHVNLYVSDLAVSRAFYEQLLPPAGMPVNRDFEGIAVGFGDRNYAAFALVVQSDPIQPIHVAFRLETHEQVGNLHAAALNAGGIDNGAPGLRPQYHEHYYAAFVRDPDGHNVEFVCHRKIG